MRSVVRFHPVSGGSRSSEKKCVSEFADYLSDALRIAIDVPRYQSTSEAAGAHAEKPPSRQKGPVRKKTPAVAIRFTASARTAKYAVQRGSTPSANTQNA